MILSDSSVWIDYFRHPKSPAAQRLDAALGNIEVMLGDLVMVEILQGLREGPQLRLVEASLKTFRVVSLCGPEIAPKAAANYRELRRAGKTIRATIDVVIATWCIENDVPLLHNDRDFDLMEDHLRLPIWR